MLNQSSITSYLKPCSNKKYPTKRVPTNQPINNPTFQRVLYHWEIQHDSRGAYVIGDLDGRGWETSYITEIRMWSNPNLVVKTRNNSCYLLPIYSRIHQFECWRLV